MAEARRVRRHLTKRRARDARHDEGDPAIVSDEEDPASYT